MSDALVSGNSCGTKPQTVGLKSNKFTETEALLGNKSQAGNSEQTDCFMSPKRKSNRRSTGTGNRRAGKRRSGRGKKRASRRRIKKEE